MTPQEALAQALDVEARGGPNVEDAARAILDALPEGWVLRSTDMTVELAALAEKTRTDADRLAKALRDGLRALEREGLMRTGPWPNETADDIEAMTAVLAQHDEAQR